MNLFNILSLVNDGEMTKKNEGKVSTIIFCSFSDDSSITKQNK
jgi:hypothetical protein